MQTLSLTFCHSSHFLSFLPNSIYRFLSKPFTKRWWLAPWPIKSEHGRGAFLFKFFFYFHPIREARHDTGMTPLRWHFRSWRTSLSLPNHFQASKERKGWNDFWTCEIIISLGKMRASYSLNFPRGFNKNWQNFFFLIFKVNMLDDDACWAFCLCEVETLTFFTRQLWLQPLAWPRCREICFRLGLTARDREVKRFGVCMSERWRINLYFCHALPLINDISLAFSWLRMTAQKSPLKQAGHSP